MQNPTIAREQQLDPSLIPPLDPSLLNLSDEERKFLRWSISEDDEDLQEKIMRAQAEYVRSVYPLIGRPISLIVCADRA